MAHSIQSARKAGASQIICLFHWGNEYEQRPNTQQRALAALCHRLGVEMVIGSHPHVVQSVETVCDTTGRITHLTAFSMGNFLSNQRFPGTDGGISLRITLTQEGESAPCFQPEYLIHWTAILPDSSRRSGRCYRVIPSYERDLLPAPQKEAFDRFLQRTRRYMSRYSHGFAEITTRPTATPASCNSAASSAVRP
ncbi:MAG: CapA family protein, partial [Alistipes sp.]|nr:CapA family protein [Alistipes sp.]